MYRSGGIILYGTLELASSEPASPKKHLQESL